MRGRKPWVAPQTLLWEPLACRTLGVLRAERESLETEIKFRTELVIKEKEVSKILDKGLSRTCLFSTNKVIQV